MQVDQIKALVYPLLDDGACFMQSWHSEMTVWKLTALVGRSKSCEASALQCTSAVQAQLHANKQCT